MLLRTTTVLGLARWRRKKRKRAGGEMGERRSAVCGGRGGCCGLFPTVFDDLADLALVFSLVVHEKTGGLSVCGRVGVGVTQQRLDGRQDGRDIVDGCPHVLEDVETDASVRIHCRSHESTSDPSPSQSTSQSTSRSHTRTSKQKQRGREEVTHRLDGRSLRGT